MQRYESLKRYSLAPRIKSGAGCVAGAHFGTGLAVTVDPRHKDEGICKRVRRCSLILATLLIALPAAAQDRATLTDDLDIFAAAFFDNLQPVSIEDGVEYCGLFIRDAEGRFVASTPRRGEADSCQPEDDPDDAPPGFEVLASYHTHGAYDRDADTEVPSWDDLDSDIEEEIDGYIATPGGRLWLNDAVAEKSILLCGEGCVVTDPDYRPCPAFPPGTDHTLGSLRARAENDTGDC